MISILTSTGSKNLILRGVQTAGGAQAIAAGSITATGSVDRLFWDNTLAALTVTASPTFALGGAATSATVTIATASVLGSVSGGAPPYTYLWTIDSSDGLSPAWVISSPTTIGTNFYVPGVADGDIRDASMKLTVTDARGATGSVTVPVQVENYGSF